MWQRFTERARRVVFFAQEEAARLGENYVGTEHVLLGLVRESDSVAARILDRLGVPLGRIRANIEEQVTRGHGNLGQDMQLTPRAKRVIDLAYEEARQLNNNYIGTEHILLGLIREGDGLAARVLVKLGADLERTRREVYAMQESGETATAPPPKDEPSNLVEMLERAIATNSWALAARTAERGTELARARACISDLCGMGDPSPDECDALLQLAGVLKSSLKVDRNAHRALLKGRTVAMLFEKQSLRTRVTFEAGVFQMGGHAVYLQPSDIAMGKRESVADVARNLERWVDGIVARVYSHATIRELAENANVPVINALCDQEHPCQALTDALTIRERRGELKGQRVVFVGDGNNVTHSLMRICAKLGAHFVWTGPEGYDPDPEVVAKATAEAETSEGSVALIRDPREACRGADVIYTDVWTSMGQEDEAPERARVFAPYQVNEELAALAMPDYLFLHCLPAHRGEEVTAGVIDGPNSGVFDQAENRLHAQKAVLAVLIR